MAQIKKEGAEVRMFRVPREENYEAIMAAKLATSEIVKVEKALCTENILVGAMEEKKNWQTLILQYLKDNIYPANPKETQKIVRLSSKYVIDLNELYRRSFS